MKPVLPILLLGLAPLFASGAAPQAANQDRQAAPQASEPPVVVTASTATDTGKDMTPMYRDFPSYYYWSTSHPDGNHR